MSEKIELWTPKEPAPLSPSMEPAEIASMAIRLSKRDQRQVAKAFESDSYEMASTFVWTRTMALLKQQLASLGMEFVGEMLGRPDIDEDSLVEQTVTDWEALRLAEALGIAGPTETLRLRQALETVQHFASSQSGNEEMSREEAVSCLRACVKNVLGQEQLEAALRFSEFRDALESGALLPEDERLGSLAASPYFFRRTTLSVLLSFTKTREGAQLENVLANVNVILPAIWSGLRDPERWQAGQTYAELYADGQRAAVAGLKSALMQVRGFDYVPETLRSETFASAANKVLRAHEDWDNWHHEAIAMRTLAALGSSIPMPAFPVAARALLCVYLGNSYGHSFAAESLVTPLLDSLHDGRWVYYLDDCLPGDEQILNKLLQAKPFTRWRQLAVTYKFGELAINNKTVSKLVQATLEKKPGRVESLAKNLLRVD